MSVKPPTGGLYLTEGDSEANRRKTEVQRRATYKKTFKLEMTCATTQTLERCNAEPTLTNGDIPKDIINNSQCKFCKYSGEKQVIVEFEPQLLSLVLLSLKRDTFLQDVVVENKELKSFSYAPNSFQIESFLTPEIVVEDSFHQSIDAIELDLEFMEDKDEAKIDEASQKVMFDSLPKDISECSSFRKLKKRIHKTRAKLKTMRAAGTKIRKKRQRQFRTEESTYMRAAEENMIQEQKSRRMKEIEKMEKGQTLQAPARIK